MKSVGSVQCRADDGVAWITLDRPDVMNALSGEMLRQLSALLDQLRADPATRAVIVTGAGDAAFSAGADIDYLSRATALEVREYARLAVAVNDKIETLGKPVIAAINGYALGGGLELAEACMLRVAVSRAMLGHPEVRIGGVAGFGGTSRLPRLIGKGRAAELLMTGNLVTAAEAHRLGLINRVAEDNRLVDEVDSLVREILSRAPKAVAMTWEAIHRGLNVSLEEATRLGADYFGLVAATQDFREGTSAFLRRRTASFVGE